MQSWKHCAFSVIRSCSWAHDVRLPKRPSVWVATNLEMLQIQSIVENIHSRGFHSIKRLFCPVNVIPKSSFKVFQNPPQRTNRKTIISIISWYIYQHNTWKGRRFALINLCIHTPKKLVKAQITNKQKAIWQMCDILYNFLVTIAS